MLSSRNDQQEQEETEWIYGVEGISFMNDPKELREEETMDPVGVGAGCETVSSRN